MAEDCARLSRSMEDYLEAIYNLKIESQVARVKDIARAMGVKMPSVTEAIRSLASKGLVKHAPYENVELTENGLELARNIAHRHSAVKDFLVGVLGLDQTDAEAEACGIEHAIRPETLDKLLKFAAFVRACDDDQSLRLAHFQHYMKHGTYPENCAMCRSQSDVITTTKLSNLCPGAKGRIAFVSGRGPIRKRLMEMGVTSDTSFEVVRAAPFGDPIEIKIRGYHLSLRKSEAEHVEVKL
ncbi:MAG: metal-dependent transcriptional regulator [Armatimonadota bacterium]